MAASYVYEVLLIGGRSGVGKTSIAAEVSVQLQAASVPHCLIEGDALSAAYPPPPGDPHRTRLAEENLAAIWRNYTALGYRRLIYTNTVSVLESDMIARAMGGATRVTGVLLTASDGATYQRLAARENGSELRSHLSRSADMSQRLDAETPAWVVRVPTDGRSVLGIAHEVIAASHWTLLPERVTQASPRRSAAWPGRE